MIRFTRSLAVLVLGITLLGVLAAPTLAKPGSNPTASAVCLNGGYLTYTEVNGTTFRNEGECARYAAQGGTLKPVAVPTATLTFEAVAGVTGACTAVLSVTNYPSGMLIFRFATLQAESPFHVNTGLMVNADGTGSTSSSPYTFPTGHEVTAGTGYAYAEVIATGTVAC